MHFIAIYGCNVQVTSDCSALILQSVRKSRRGQRREAIHYGCIAALLIVVAVQVAFFAASATITIVITLAYILSKFARCTSVVYCLTL